MHSSPAWSLVVLSNVAHPNHVSEFPTYTSHRQPEPAPAPFQICHRRSVTPYLPPAAATCTRCPHSPFAPATSSPYTLPTYSSLCTIATTPVLLSRAIIDEGEIGDAFVAITRAHESARQLPDLQVRADLQRRLCMMQKDATKRLEACLQQMCT